jgi:sugar phosphate isomerase/epimerase
MPIVCGYSGNLARVPYTEMGMMMSDIGYDGVDLTVLPGGHVDPRITNVDMMRAVEVVASANLELPMISTDITTTQNPTAYPVLYLAGQAGVRFFRTGWWPNNPAGSPARFNQVKTELLSVILLARRCNMVAMVPNKAGNFVGHSLAETERLIGDLDAGWVGSYFDVANAVADAGPDGWEATFRALLPRIRAIALQDFRFVGGDANGDRRVQMCAMGEGVVDWKKFFALLAATHYNGPLSLHMEYATQDELGAMTRDLEFTRKQIEAAWSGSGTL